MSWDSNRDKGKPVEQFRRKNNLRRLRDEIKEREPLKALRWDIEDERETTQAPKEME